MIRGIPPRTMSDIARALGARAAVRRPMPPADRVTPVSRSQGAPPYIVPLKKPREWRYQTRPFFRRVQGPLVDVFNEAEEILIVVDLGGFTRGEISLSMTPEHYVLRAVRGEQRFEETIDLPPNVDAERARERLVNGVLEIMLPRRRSRRAAGSKQASQTQR